ncbi:hypothetical protein [Stutzerimonas stutzeri]|uniref:hypothetical protein n=1 Tax=Stutzerimonas TaxID=2901164 RepID=UPI001BB0C9D0|nr:hypothetical protein [Stutzerimonas stutzeri]QUE74390.1 hypothetical protein KCX70_13980 [Stutzerimonas stutzeri]
MDYESIANAFYGTPITPPEAPDSLLGTGKTPEPVSRASEAPIEELSWTESAAEAFYGMSENQVPADQHYPELSDFYESMEREDRINGEEVDGEAFHASSTALQQFAAEAGFGRDHMRALMTAAKDAISNPITSYQSLQARNEHCLSTLRATWGSEFDRNLAYAKAEAARLSRSVPNAGQVLDMGAGSDPALVKLLAEAGRTRARRK